MNMYMYIYMYTYILIHSRWRIHSPPKRLIEWFWDPIVHTNWDVRDVDQLSCELYPRFSNSFITRIYKQTYVCIYNIYMNMYMYIYLYTYILRHSRWRIHSPPTRLIERFWDPIFHTNWDVRDVAVTSFPVNSIQDFQAHSLHGYINIHVFVYIIYIWIYTCIYTCIHIY